MFGGLAALSLPLSVLASPPLATGVAVLTREVYPTVTQAMYLGGGFTNAPFPFPLGWYWWARWSPSDLSLPNLTAWRASLDSSIPITR